MIFPGFFLELFETCFHADYEVFFGACCKMAYYAIYVWIIEIF